MKLTRVEIPGGVRLASVDGVCVDEVGSVEEFVEDIAEGLDEGEFEGRISVGFEVGMTHNSEIQAVSGAGPGTGGTDVNGASVFVPVSKISRFHPSPLPGSGLDNGAAAPIIDCVIVTDILVLMLVISMTTTTWVSAGMLDVTVSKTVSMASSALVVTV